VVYPKQEKTHLGIDHESHSIGDITLISHDLGWEQPIKVDLSSLEGPYYSKHRITHGTAEGELISDFGDGLLIGTGNFDKWDLLISLVAPQRPSVEDYTADHGRDTDDTLVVSL
jgi:hypothetical protein